MNIEDQQYYVPYDDYESMDPSWYQRPDSLQQQVLHSIDPAVSHGLREAQHLGYKHALTEAVAIGYLMGRGYDFDSAWKTVESWWHGTHLPTQY